MLESQKPMDDYVAETRGINILTRRKMMKALTEPHADEKMRKLIWDSPEHHFKPEVLETLKDYWMENFSS